MANLCCTFSRLGSQLQSQCLHGICNLAPAPSSALKALALALLSTWHSQQLQQLQQLAISILHTFDICVGESLSHSATQGQAQRSASPHAALSRRTEPMPSGLGSAPAAHPASTRGQHVILAIPQLAPACPSFLGTRQPSPIPTSSFHLTPQLCKAKAARARKAFSFFGSHSLHSGFKSTLLQRLPQSLSRSDFQLLSVFHASRSMRCAKVLELAPLDFAAGCLGELCFLQRHHEASGHRATRRKHAAFVGCEMPRGLCLVPAPCGARAWCGSGGPPANPGQSGNAALGASAIKPLPSPPREARRISPDLARAHAVAHAAHGPNPSRPEVGKGPAFRACGGVMSRHRRREGRRDLVDGIHHILNLDCSQCDAGAAHTWPRSNKSWHHG